MMNKMKVVQDPRLKDKAVLYLRYSSESQTENSIEGQRRECMEFARKNGMAVLSEYIDRAMTGTNDNRPEFRRMIRDSSKNAFGNVIVWKSDRFSRDMLDAVRYERELGKTASSFCLRRKPISIRQKALFSNPSPWDTTSSIPRNFQSKSSVARERT